MTSPATRIRDHAAATPHAVALRDKHFGVVAGVDVGDVLGARAARRSRLPGAGHRARRPDRRPLGEPPRVADRRHGRDGGPRRVGGDLPDEPGRRGGLPAARLGRQADRGRGPGAARQDARRDRRVPRPEAPGLSRAARHPEPLRPRRADRLGGLPRDRPAAPRRAARGPRRRTRCPDGRRPRHARLHLRHHRAAEGRDADRAQRRVRDQGAGAGGRVHRPTARPGGPEPVLPPARTRRRADLQHLVQRCRGDPGQLRGVDRDGAAEPARGPADDPLRRPADLGEAARRHRRPDERRHLGQAAARRVLARRRRPDRPAAGRDRRQAHGLEPAALRDRLAVLLPDAQGPPRHAEGAVRRLGRGADRTGGAALLHGHRRADARGLRHDREHRGRHRQPAGPGPAGHRRRGAPRHRAADRRGHRRDPHPERGRVRGLLEPAGGDPGSGHRGRLAAHRRRRRVGRRDARQDHRPDEGHHHHGRRQEHLALADRERAQGVAVRP